MWIDFDQPFGVVVGGLWWGASSPHFGVDSVAVASGIILPHSRARRLVAARFE